jgi:hypothetical protein
VTVKTGTILYFYSDDAKRFFSKYNLLMTPQRARLAPETAGALVTEFKCLEALVLEPECSSLKAYP